MEDMSTSSAPRFAFSRMPSGPYAMASTCGDAGTIVMTTSASPTASAIEAAPVPPASDQPVDLVLLRVYPVTE